MFVVLLEIFHNSSLCLLRTLSRFLIFGYQNGTMRHKPCLIWNYRGYVFFLIFVITSDRDVINTCFVYVFPMVIYFVFSILVMEQGVHMPRYVVWFIIRRATNVNHNNRTQHRCVSHEKKLSFKMRCFMKSLNMIKYMSYINK